MRTTWKPHEKHGLLTRQSDLPDSVYAFPKERKEPLTDARHVRNALSRSPISRRQPITTGSISLKRRGTISALILNASAPPRSLRHAKRPRRERKPRREKKLAKRRVALRPDSLQLYDAEPLRVDVDGEASLEHPAVDVLTVCPLAE